MKSKILIPAVITMTLIFTWQRAAKGESEPAAKKRDSTPATMTTSAQAEAVKRYPDLGKPGSAFNLEFVARVKRYRTEKADFFTDPVWPLKLADEVASATATLAEGASPTSAEGIKPLWILSTEQLTTPGKKTSARFLTATKTGNLFFTLGGSMGDQERAVALVDGASGKLLQKSSFVESPEGTTEWFPSYTVTPDGSVILCSVSWRTEASDNSRRASVHLRALDPLSGKIVNHIMMAFDDPAKNAESGSVVWMGAGCVQVGCFGQRIAVANPYFLAEFDMASLKLIHSTKVPNATGAGTTVHVLETGAMWDIQDRKRKDFCTKFGGEVREITKKEYEAGKAKAEVAERAKGGSLRIDAQVKKGAVEIEAKDAGDHVILPNRKIALALASPAKEVFAYSIPRGCVLMVRCEGDKEFFCVVPLPTK